MTANDQPDQPDQPTNGDDTVEQRQRQLVYARRRITAAFAAIVALGLIVAVWAPTLLSTGPTTDEDGPAPDDDALREHPIPLEERGAESRHPLDLMVEDAQRYRDHTGTFDGVDIDADHVAVGDTLVIVGHLDGDCWMAGHLDGQPVDAQIEPSGAACTPDELDTLRDQLTVTYEVNTGVLDDELHQAADGLHSWAMATGGTFDGASWPEIDVVVADDGHSAQLYAVDSSSCRTLVVDSTGERSEPTSC